MNNFDFIICSISIIPIFYELLMLFYTQFMLNYNKEAYEQVDKNVLETTKNQKWYIIISPLYTIWSIIGLFTPVWYLFVILLLLGDLPIHKLFKLDKHSVKYTKFDASISLILLVSILLSTII